MRFLFLSFLLTVLYSNNIAAQQNNSIDTAFTAYFDKFPAVQSSAEEAWKAYTAKNKLTVTKQFANEIQAQINILADRSNHQSYLLSWFADKFEKASSSRNKLSEIKIQKDKVLENAVQDASTAYFSLLDDYVRKMNYSQDTLLKKYTGYVLAEKQLQAYQKEIPVLCSKVKSILYKTHQLMQSKGYNKVLQQGDAKHPYFVQLLEARGLFFDRLRELNRMVDAANLSAAQLIDYCKKDPVYCK